MNQIINSVEVSEPLLCNIPFNQFLVDMNGDVNLCCGSYIKDLPYSAGNLYESDALAIWNNAVYKKFRCSFADGSLRYCNEANCSAAANKHDPEKRRIIFSPDEIMNSLDLKESNFSSYINNPLNFDGSITGLPTKLYLGMDLSCNLKCPSCRDRLIIEDKDSTRLDLLYKNLRSITPGIKSLELDGAGEVFASHWYQRFLKDFPVDDFPSLKDVLFRSNGILWTEKNWLKIHEYFRSRHIHACISIDAAKSATYTAVRGGSFEKLLKNMKYVKSLRLSGEIAELTLVFVYRRTNYKEIPLFIELGREHLATRLVVHPVQAWGGSTYVNSGTYDDEAIHLPTHPDHGQFRDFVEKNKIERTAFVDFLF